MNRKEAVPFVLYANCLPVKGAERGAICDVQRCKIHLVPNSLIDFIIENQKRSINDVKNSFSPEDGEVIDEYFEYLIINELIFFTSEPDCFPPMELDWQNPSLIAECIIDINSDITIAMEKVFNSLSNLRCRALELRIYSEPALSDIEKLLKWAEDSTITSISLIKKYNAAITMDQIGEVCDQNKRITKVTVFGAEEPFSGNSKALFTPITYSSQQVVNEKCCGMIHSDFFSVNLETFTEALNHNSCLNRKIAIDSEGNIKNCPSMQQRFGNIRDTTLEAALDKPEFRKFWNIDKGQITKCKDCEFRYVCTDCRAYLETPDDLYSAPLKCGYDPYTCEWKEWSTHPMKQQAIDHYGLRNIL